MFYNLVGAGFLLLEFAIFVFGLCLMVTGTTKLQNGKIANRRQARLAGLAIVFPFLILVLHIFFSGPYSRGMIDYARETFTGIEGLVFITLGILAGVILVNVSIPANSRCFSAGTRQGFFND